MKFRDYIKEGVGSYSFLVTFDEPPEGDLQWMMRSAFKPAMKKQGLILKSVKKTKDPTEFKVNVLDSGDDKNLSITIGQLIMQARRSGVGFPNLDDVEKI